MENLGNAVSLGSGEEEKEGQLEKADRFKIEKGRMQNLPTSFLTICKDRWKSTLAKHAKASTTFVDLS